MAGSELERKFRVADQMLTAFSVLRDRYRCRALILKLSLLFISVLLCALTLACASDWLTLGISPEGGRWLIAGTASFVFFLSLAELMVGWTSQSATYGAATVRLAALKRLYRERLSGDTEPSERVCKSLAKEFEEAMVDLPPIPEAVFLQVKRIHVRKVAISRELDGRPGAPLWLLKCELLYQSFRKRGKTRNSKDG